MEPLHEGRAICSGRATGQLVGSVDVQAVAVISAKEYISKFSQYLVICSISM